MPWRRRQHRPSPVSNRRTAVYGRSRGSRRAGDQEGTPARTAPASRCDNCSTSVQRLDDAASKTDFRVSCAHSEVTSHHSTQRNVRHTMRPRQDQPTSFGQNPLYSLPGRRGVVARGSVSGCRALTWRGDVRGRSFLRGRWRRRKFVHKRRTLCD